MAIYLSSCLGGLDLDNSIPYQLCRKPPNTSEMSEKKAVIKNADMSGEMQQEAVACTTQALEKNNIEKDIAVYIRKEFDKSIFIFMCKSIRDGNIPFYKLPGCFILLLTFL